MTLPTTARYANPAVCTFSNNSDDNFSSPFSVSQVMSLVGLLEGGEPYFFKHYSLCSQETMLELVWCILLLDRGVNFFFQSLLLNSVPASGLFLRQLFACSLLLSNLFLSSLFLYPLSYQPISIPAAPYNLFLCSFQPIHSCGRFCPRSCHNTF